MTDLRVSLIGAGGWGSNVLRALTRVEGASLVSVCDINQKKIKSLSAQYPSISFTGDLKDIERDGSIDAVVIATPSPTHAEIAKSFLESGRAVFVEKPMAVSLEDARRLYELSTADKGPPLMVGHLLIYHPATNIVKDLVRKGDIGDVYYIYSKRLNLGVVRQNENVLWSLAPHDISVVLYLMGEMPEAVSVHGSSYLTKGVQDVAFMTLFFPGGRMAQVHVSWLDPHKEGKVVVVGSKKMVVFDDMEANEKVKIYNKGAEVKGSADLIESISIRHGEIMIPLVPPVEPLIAEMEYFVKYVNGDLPPLSGPKEGLDVVRVLTAGNESMVKNGQVIAIK
ncbi:MAG: Gfo/Idh/MocA family oxidoreductase [Deltaproteobacteria bacterium]|uniref:Gfo/Idh/MocA family oxidoreductase n=1 Tax=Candidatus Zymogenus saltonus TaxID=2844893 RepID=A0A9D8KH60_9DELT|nr:Gfo/Idh/MocA family oxidoreductase [Candidatus Zymogenus saltonus]